MLLERCHPLGIAQRQCLPGWQQIQPAAASVPGETPHTPLVPESPLGASRAIPNPCGDACCEIHIRYEDRVYSLCFIHRVLGIRDPTDCWVRCLCTPHPGPPQRRGRGRSRDSNPGPRRLSRLSSRGPRALSPGGGRGRLTSPSGRGTARRSPALCYPFNPPPAAPRPLPARTARPLR